VAVLLLPNDKQIDASALLGIRLSLVSFPIAATLPANGKNTIHDAALGHSSPQFQPA
jgi:hypothetical protein